MKTHVPDAVERDDAGGNRQRQMSSTADVFESLIVRAVEIGVRKVFNVNEVTNRRLLSVEESAVYLGLSKREIYNMIATGELPPVRHRRRKMLDIRDLDHWIERNKAV